MQAARDWFSRILLGVNVTILLILIFYFVLPGVRFTAPWDGPAVVTIVLTAATVVLGAVAIGVALLAVWGYSALREHAALIADSAASAAAEKKLQEVMRIWGLDKLGAPNEEVARAYTKETGGG